MNDKSTENKIEAISKRSSKLARRRRKSIKSANAAESGSVLRRCLMPKRLTYAALIDKGREIEITDFMVRRAGDEIEGMQQFPFAPLPANAAS